MIFRGAIHSGLSAIPEGTHLVASRVLKMSVSLDGFVASPDRSTDWSLAGRNEDGAAWTLETLSNAEEPRMGLPGKATLVHSH
jgi:hypothetical protein